MPKFEDVKCESVEDAMESFKKTIHEKGVVMAQIKGDADKFILGMSSRVVCVDETLDAVVMVLNRKMLGDLIKVFNASKNRQVM